MASYAIGYDVGSSSVKAALVRVDDGATMIVVQYPETEMRITSPQPGWAEQDPEDWWQALCAATHQLLERSGVAPRQIASIGLAYQMHGLVLVDTDGKPVRPAIIWCDSRAVETGDQALRAMGAEYCFGHLLNSPGNFTAARLKWVIDHEPEIYQQAQYLLLPGDFLALRLTGTACTTISGLSEAILWDFAGHRVAQRALDYFGIDPQKVPPLTDTFGQQGVLSRQGAEATGLMAGTPLTYRAGDQPNNAMSLGVVHAGEVAATGGTSGVIYGVADRLISDPESRVNSFAHVTHTVTDPRIGMLLCINGAGIEHAWMKHHVAHPGATYEEMERAMQSVPIGCDGLTVLPFGNGAERMLGNVFPGAQVNHLDFNRHGRGHLIRAGLEGVAFAVAHGFTIFRALGFNPSVIRVGNDNLFRSAIFGTTLAALLQCRIEVHAVTGAVGAALASIHQGSGHALAERIAGNRTECVYEPEGHASEYQAAYAQWVDDLQGLRAHPGWPRGNTLR